MARATRAGSSAGFPELNRRGGARGSVPADIMMPRLGLLVAVVLLVLIGIVMVFSASTVEAIHNGESATSYVVKQAIFAVFGSALALFVYARDYRSLQGGPCFWVFWGICVALLLAVPVIGTNILGATRWIYIGGFSVQPTEFAKIMLVVAAAKVLLEYRDQIRDRKQALIAAFVLVLLPLLFLYKTQSDMGSAVVILVGAFVVMWLGGLPGRFVAVLGIAVVVGGVFGIVGYRADRVSVWLDPWSDQYDTGYQMIRSFFAFSEGGILGVGLGNSREKFLYLPEAETDFIFSIIGEELGLVGALFVIALFVAVLVCGLLIAKRASRRLRHDDCRRPYLHACGSGVFEYGLRYGIVPHDGQAPAVHFVRRIVGCGVAFDGGYHHVGFACGGRRSAYAASRERRATSSEPELYSRGRRTASAFALLFV